MNAQAHLQHWPSKLLLVFLCFFVAAVSFGGFFEKWNFRDGTKFSGMAIAEGKAARPFVYRQLLPTLSNIAERAVPNRINHGFQSWLARDPKHHNMIYSYFPNAVDSANVAYAVRYYTLYFLAFLSLVAAVFALRKLCLDLYGDQPAATLAAMGMALLLPVFLTEGGYYYDLAELLFMPLAVILAMRGNLWLLALLVGVATFNKESFLLFVITLYPFLRARLNVKRAIALEAGLLAIAVVVNVLVKYQFSSNPGEFAQFQLLDHLRWLMRPTSYFLFEVNYGVPTPKGLNIINLLLLATLVRNSWKYLSPAMRQHIWLAFGISFPLFLAFCYEGELRNFSLLYVGFTVMLCVNVAMVLQRWYRGAVTLRSAGIAVPEPEARPVLLGGEVGRTVMRG
ncbi:TonB-dependent receptor [Novimethylophilus kurashikiensis]|uniref:TonB-dependent receptor n=1 Tax=Novimethylophilus kurashikiensis TaxID=1825523 RepID=A0A2R5F6Z8_9PROT|nr:hypothetical protein [Novimethylophilus kurashikiensis]GBG14006.1 TonB-dependent receptor [Novimethylophilus kurashikiensis]